VKIKGKKFLLFVVALAYYYRYKKEYGMDLESHGRADLRHVPSD
jgi:hypothetical protein